MIQTNVLRLAITPFLLDVARGDKTHRGWIRME